MHRATRWLLATAYALALAAYLTLAGIQSPGEAGGDDPVYVVVGTLGVTGLIVLFGWPGLVLLPVVTVAFGVLYEELVWDRPAGLPMSMDYIAYYPSSVAYVLVFALPYAFVVMLARMTVLRARSSAG